MKTLYIIRHAKSSWKDMTLNDRERPLNRRGIQNAHELATEIRKSEFRIDRIISSPAVRAYKTARIVCDNLALHDDRMVADESLYMISPSDFFQFVCELNDDLNHVMIIGHEPALSYFVNQFLEHPLEKLVTASLTRMDFNTDQWGKISSSNLESIIHKNRQHWAGRSLM